MTRRASECAKCKNWWTGEAIPPDERPREPVCLKGHRPRFLRRQPRYSFELQEWLEDPGGYRRVCEDFEERGKHESE